MRDAVNSNLGIVRQPSLHGATLALLISRLLLLFMLSTAYTAPYALLDASANTCKSAQLYNTWRGEMNLDTRLRSTKISLITKLDQEGLSFSSLSFFSFHNVCKNIFPRTVIGLRQPNGSHILDTRDNMLRLVCLHEIS